MYSNPLHQIIKALHKIIKAYHKIKIKIKLINLVLNSLHTCCHHSNII